MCMEGSIILENSEHQVTRPDTPLAQSLAGGQGPFFEVTRTFGQEQ